MASQPSRSQDLPCRQAPLRTSLHQTSAVISCCSVDTPAVEPNQPARAEHSSSGTSSAYAHIQAHDGHIEPLCTPKWLQVDQKLFFWGLHALFEPASRSATRSYHGICDSPCHTLLRPGSIHLHSRAPLLCTVAQFRLPSDRTAVTRSAQAGQSPTCVDSLCALTARPDSTSSLQGRKRAVVKHFAGHRCAEHSATAPPLWPPTRTRQVRDAQ